MLCLIPLNFSVFAQQGGGAADENPVAPVTKRRGSKTVQGEFVPGQILVRFRGGEEVAGMSDKSTSSLWVRSRSGREIPVEIENFEGSEIVEGLRIARVQPEDTLHAVEALNALPEVLYAEPDYIWRKSLTPNDSRFSEQYALQKISAPQAWDKTTGSKSVVVAVIDGGVNTAHPDLQGNIWTNPGEVAGDGVDNDGNGFIDDVNGWDFTTCTSSSPTSPAVCGNNTVFDGEDGDDHGTHVAGTIGARGNNSNGVAGVNWQVSIMSVKVLGPDGGSTSNIIRGYKYVKMMRDRGINVRVTNNSYGGAGISQSAMAAISELNTSGILFVAAAGNESTDNFGIPHYPSNYDLPNIIAVASTNNSDIISSFSNYGARIVSMGAPGSSILSTVPTSVSADGYAYFSGTSMASPHVAGAAALVLSANPTIPVKNLRGALAYTGDVLPSLQAKTTTGRRLNLNAALLSGQENDVTAPSAPANLQVIGTSGRTVTLRWTAPGDNANTGTAADYDFFLVNPTTGVRLLLPTTLLPAQAGTVQSANVSLPYQTYSGTVELRVYDNAGNFSSSSVPVSVTQNGASDPYIVTLSAPGALSVGGTRLALDGDDVLLPGTGASLPFGLPYFGRTGFDTPTGVIASSNGVLYFVGEGATDPPRRDNGDGDDAESSVQGLQGQMMIAPMWDDIMIDTSLRPDAGLYMVTAPDNSTVIFRWQGVTFDTPLSNNTTRGNQPVNFEVELRRNGTIIMRYGAGQVAPTNTKLFPVVGISNGEPNAYVVASHTSETTLKNLTNAQTVTFTPRPAGPPPPPAYTISGRVADSSNNSIPGVTMTMSSAAGTTFLQTDSGGLYSFPNIATGTYTVTPSKPGYTFSLPSQTFSVTNVSLVGNFTAVPQVPALLAEEGTSRAVALDSVTQVRGPFPITTLNNFSTDHYTRVMLFVSNFVMGPGDNLSIVSVQAQGIPLAVESVGKVPGVDASYIVVRLTNQLPAGDLPMTIKVRGATSNTLTLAIRR
jgi:subtilisin family serine protease